MAYADDDRFELQFPAVRSARVPDLTALPRPRINLAWLIVPCLAADALMVPIFTSLHGPPSDFSAVIAFGTIGCVLAQGSLLAAWLAWSDVPFLRRLWAHWKLASGLFAIWFAGLWLAVMRDDDAQRLGATVALGVPLVSLAAQAPLWLVRQWWGWRLVRPTGEQAPPRDRPLTIRDLMTATIVAAVSLALARLAPADGKDVWPVWAGSCAVACFISAISVLPAGSLLLRSPQLSHGLWRAGLYTAAWIALPWIIAAAVRWYGGIGLPPRALFIGLSSLMFTFACTLTLTAAIARDRGYGLISRRDPIAQ